MSNILKYPKSLGFTQKEVEAERQKLSLPDLWELQSTAKEYQLRFKGGGKL